MKTLFSDAVASAVYELACYRDPVSDLIFMHHIRSATSGGYLSFRVRERTREAALKSPGACTLTRAASTVTVVKTAHGLALGDLAVVTAPSTLSGDWTVATVSDADTFTYTHTTAGALGPVTGVMASIRRTPYTGVGDNIPLGNQTSSYMCRIPNFHGVLEVTLNRADATHDVWVDEAVGGSGPVAVDHRRLSVVACGELQGSAAALQLPTVACKLVRFKAVVSNAGNVYLGGAGVTKVDGTTDVTSGLELTPGDDTGWIPTDNLNRFYRICDNAGDDLTYLALA